MIHIRIRKAFIPAVLLLSLTAAGCLPTIDDSAYEPNVIPLSALESCYSPDLPESSRLSVLQFNIWQEGTKIPGGYDAIINEILRVKPDLVALSEVRNYAGKELHQRMVESLAAEGETWYSFLSEDSGLLSRFPIIEEKQLYPVKNDHGSITAAVVRLPSGLEIAFYSAHLDYKNCAYYEPRGYSGNTWAPIKKQLDVDLLHEMNLASERDDAIRAFIADAQQQQGAGRLIILAGDFNEPSHLDWIEANKDLYEHNGVVIDWDVSVMLENAGYIDSWREIYPDPVAAPGFTYPSANPDTTISSLTWAPRSDERERIDFIWYRPESRLKLCHSLILGPDSSIAYSQNVKENGIGEILEPEAVWPTDHKALISLFELPQ